jgi:predicted CXXCH cytochrome family protein
VRSSSAGLLAGIALALIAAGVFYRFRQSPAVPTPDDGYTDGADCIRCHGDIAKTYRETGMGRSLAAARPDTMFDRDSTFYHAASDRYYTMYRKDGKYYLRRHQLGPDGKETNVVEKQSDFVVGSGNHARTYLHREPSGQLLELPVSRYSEKGGYLAMSPGFDNSHHADFRRQVLYECIFCHTGYPEISPGADRSGLEPLFPGRVPEGIDCQRCHGPGRKHSQAAQSGKADVVRATIVNPARLSTERQLELCMQCHLETTSARLPHTILRTGRGAFSYRPGEPLANFVLHFDHAPGTGHDDKFEIAQQAYRFRQSACFQKSGGRLLCTTCHNPHQALRGDEAAKHYTQVCRSCHTQQTLASRHHPAANNCIECHMPKRRTEDVVHVLMTDHYIQRRRPAGDLLAPRAERDVSPETLYRGPVIPYYPAALPPGDNVYLALAQVKEGNNLAQGIPQLAAALQDGSVKDGEFYFELAEAYSRAGQTVQAVRQYEEATRRKPDFRPAWVGLARALAASGQDGRAVEAYQKSSELGPENATILTECGLVLLRQGNRAEAVKRLERAVAVDPDDPTASNNLGSALRDSGDLAGAQTAFRNSIRSQPDFAAAQQNLANLLASGHDLPQAGYHYEKAIAADPKIAMYREEYAAALAAMEQFGKAREQFAEAVRLDPGSAPSQAGLADMLAIEGNMAGAVDHYRKALAIQPGLDTAHLGIGSALAAQGRLPEALPHLEKAAASQDPSIRESARQALESVRTGRPSR